MELNEQRSTFRIATDSSTPRPDLEAAFAREAVEIAAKFDRGQSAAASTRTKKTSKS